MPRSRSDGTPSQPPNRHKLTELLVKRQSPRPRAFMVWDTLQRGFALSVQPTGHKAYKVVYSRHGRVRWFHLGGVSAIGLSDARRLANRVMLQVAEGKDPQAERNAARSAPTFAQLATRYVETYARKHNRSWRQADALVRQAFAAALGFLAGADYHKGRREGDDGSHQRAGRRQPDAGGRFSDLLLGG